MPVLELNLKAAWIGMTLGCLAGAVPGLFFFREEWLGGYGSWRRRMLRLAHISFFGIAFVNVAYALCAQHLGTVAGLPSSSALLLIAAISMPVVCYLAAFWPAFRHLFVVPAGALTVGVALFAFQQVLR